MDNAQESHDEVAQIRGAGLRRSLLQRQRFQTISLGVRCILRYTSRLNQSLCTSNNSAVSARGGVQPWP